MEDLLKEPSGLFEHFCRISPEDFEILNKIGGDISKKGSEWRKGVPVPISRQFQKFSLFIENVPHLICNTVSQVCTALINAMEHEMKVKTHLLIAFVKSKMHKNVILFMLTIIEKL